MSKLHGLYNSNTFYYAVVVYLVEQFTLSKCFGMYEIKPEKHAMSLSAAQMSILTYTCITVKSDECTCSLLLGVDVLWELSLHVAGRVVVTAVIPRAIGSLGITETKFFGVFPHYLRKVTWKTCENVA